MFLNKGEFSAQLLTMLFNVHHNIRLEISATRSIFVCYEIELRTNFECFKRYVDQVEYLLLKSSSANVLLV